MNAPAPCHHKRAQHTHGTYVTYTADRCRCTPCRDAATTYNRDLRRRNAYGRSNLTNANPAREHITTLTAAGVSLKQVTHLTGINGGVLSKLVYGSPSTGYTPSRRILHANAEKILAIDPHNLNNHAPMSLIDATGTTRRLQALVTTGWSQSRLAAHIDTTPADLNLVILGRDRVTVRRHLQVRDLYDQLWDTPPSETTGTERYSATRARNHARKHGWLPPMAWDDATINDPTTHPHVDDVRTARDRSSNRGYGVVNIDTLTDTADWGLTITQAAQRLGVTKAAIDHGIARLDPDVRDQLRARYARNLIVLEYGIAS